MFVLTVTQQSMNIARSAQILLAARGRKGLGSRLGQCEQAGYEAEGRQSTLVTRHCLREAFSMHVPGSISSTIKSLGIRPYDINSAVWSLQVAKFCDRG